MSDGLSTAMHAKLADHVFGCGTRNYTPPSGIKIGYSTTDPGADGSGVTEPVGNGYDQVLTDETYWNAANASAEVINALTITFPEATGDQGVAAGDSLWFVAYNADDDSFIGNSAVFLAPDDIVSGKVPRFLAGTVTISLSRTT